VGDIAIGGPGSVDKIRQGVKCVGDMKECAGRVKGAFGRYETNHSDIFQNLKTNCCYCVV
jgi:hypothetical protein